MQCTKIKHSTHVLKIILFYYAFGPAKVKCICLYVIWYLQRIPYSVLYKTVHFAFYLGYSVESVVTLVSACEKTRVCLVKHWATVKHFSADWQRVKCWLAHLFVPREMPGLAVLHDFKHQKRQTAHARIRTRTFYTDEILRLEVDHCIAIFSVGFAFYTVGIFDMEVRFSFQFSSQRCLPK